MNLVIRKYESSDAKDAARIWNEVVEDGVEAVLKDGVLTISFEKEKVEEPKRITIN